MTQSRAESPNTAGLVIIGAGASGAHTLLSLLAELSSAARRAPQPLRICVIDRDPQFFTGIAYGDRSGSTALTLSTLHEFLPDEERARFVEWVAARQVLQDASIDSAWVQRHLAEITEGRWDQLFIPRRLYGAYLADRARTAMLAAQADGVAEFALISADVTAVAPSNDGYRVAASARDGRVVQIDAATVVLAIGSPPARRLAVRDGLTDDLVHDVYDPGLDATVEGLRRRLADLPVDGREILVVGGNAAALEFVLAGQGIVRDLRARLTVLSPSGRPRHWRRKKTGEIAHLDAVTALRSKASAGERVTAAMLYESVRSDLQDAVDSGTDLAVTRALFEAIPSFLGFLHDEDRAALVARYGPAITALLRQDCGDAVDILEASVATGAVVFEAGRYLACRREGRYFRVITTDDRGRQSLLDTRFGAIVGATGFERVSDTRSPLIRHLLQTGIVDASSSDAGLRVDGRFRAAPGLFVIGPLLAGNAHPNMLIWHAESVRRIMAIASEAASCIARELNARAPKDSLSATTNN